MEPVLFVMAVLGCGDGAAACQVARIEPVRFETAAECRAAMPAVLARSTDLSYPVISVDCRRTGLEIADRQARTPRG